MLARKRLGKCPFEQLSLCITDVACKQARVECAVRLLAGRLQFWPTTSQGPAAGREGEGGSGQAAAQRPPRLRVLVERARTAAARLAQLAQA